MWGQTQLRPSLALGNSPQGCKGPAEPIGVGGLSPVLGAAPVVPLGWRELCQTSSERSPIGVGMVQSGSWCHHCCSVWLACQPAPSIILAPNLLCPQRLLGPPRVVVLWRRRKEKGRKAQTQLQRLPEATVLSRPTHLKLLPTSTPRSSCGAALPSRVVAGDPACWEHTTALGAVQCHATSGHLMAQQMRMPLRGLLSPQGVRGQNGVPLLKTLLQPSCGSGESSSSAGDQPQNLTHTAGALGRAAGRQVAAGGLGDGPR